MLLTKNSGAILGPIAQLLGYVMQGIYNLLALLGGGEANIGVTIIILTVVIYSCLYPLTYKQQKFSRLSQKMNPELQEIQKRYNGKKDQASMMKMQEETSAVYEKYGVSPTGSCLQMIIQMPILFALYRVFYNIPAYIPKVKEIFTLPEGTALTDQIMSTSGYQDKMTALVAEFRDLSSLRTDFTVTDLTSLKDYVVDVLYKLSNSGWDRLTTHYFPDLENVDQVRQTLNHVNNFLGLNISYTPWSYITEWFSHVRAGTSTGALFGFAFLAFLIPVISYVTQVISIRIGQSATNTTGNEQMAAQMKSMNILMPLMSFVICFSVPVGLGIYWIGSAVIRTVQMLFMNRQLDKIDLDEVIKANQAKAKKKREKMGIKENQIRENAGLSTRRKESFISSMTEEEREKELLRTDEIKRNARPDSMAAKANLVREYNEGHTIKKEG